MSVDFDRAARGLAALAELDDELVATAMLGRVTQASPLMVRLDGGTDPVGPVAVSGGVAPAVPDQVLVVSIPVRGSAAVQWVCLGTVTMPT